MNLSAELHDIRLLLARIEERLDDLISEHNCKPTSVIWHIRKKVFGVTQIEFAEIAGVTQPSVHHWENGVSPTLEHIAAIRAEAIKRGIEWNDEWLFAEPLDPAPATAA